MHIALINTVTIKQIDFANLNDLKMWIQTHKAFLTKKQIERFILYRAQPVPYRQYVVCSRYCTLKQFIYKYKLL